MPNRKGSRARAVGLVALGLGVLAAAALVWQTGAARSQLRERLFPIPKLACHGSADCDSLALQIQAREAVTADAAMDIALGQLVLTIVGFAGIAFTVFYARLAWREARRSADIADKGLATLERPFLVVEITDTGIDFEGSARRYRPARYRFRNHGRSPAIITQERLVMESPREGVPPPLDPLAIPGRPILHGIVVGPGGESGEHEASAALPLTSAMAATKSGRSIGGDRIYLMGFVRYRDLGGAEFLTGFCFFSEQGGFGLASPRSTDGVDRYNYDRRLT